MPYNTETMIYDCDREQYILTEEALKRSGTFLRERLAVTRCPSPEYVIIGILQDVSDIIYNFIHSCSVNEEIQDYVINTNKGARNILERALLKQAEYMLAVGNLNLSVEEDKHNKAVSQEAISILSRTIKEIGTSLLYTGV